MVQEALGELEQAKDYHQRALEIKINLLGAKHISVAGSYNNLGLVHEDDKSYMYMTWSKLGIIVNQHGKLQWMLLSRLKEKLVQAGWCAICA